MKLPRKHYFKTCFSLMKLFWFQSGLFGLTEKLKKWLDDKNVIGAVFMDLSKAVFPVTCPQNIMHMVSLRYKKNYTLIFWKEDKDWN